MSKIAIYPGTFDPMTRGHEDVVQRAARIFSRVLVAVAGSTGKNTMFDIDERVALAREVLADIDNVEVVPFEGLLNRFAVEQGNAVLVRGLRAIGDFEYEVQLANLNRLMEPSIETIFVAASQDYQFLSSSMVREIASLDGDVSGFVHPVVNAALLRVYNGAQSD